MIKWSENKIPFHACAPFPLFQSDQDQCSVTLGNDHVQKQSVGKESLSVTTCVKWSIRCYCEMLISKFSFFCYSYFICQQALVVTYLSISKYPKYLLITLYSILLPLNLLEKKKIKILDWCIGQEDREQKFFSKSVKTYLYHIHRHPMNIPTHALVLTALLPASTEVWPKKFNTADTLCPPI